MKKIIIASRTSALALIQTQFVKQFIEKNYPEFLVEILPIKSIGDLDQKKKFKDFGEIGIFVKQLEKILLEKKAHIAVHSLKDVPSFIPNELYISSYFNKKFSNDALIVRKSDFQNYKKPLNSKTFSQLTLENIIGTSSLRRMQQMKILNSKFNCQEIRGNMETRN